MMMSPLQPLTKEIDVEFLVFVERYATDLLKWDIITYFAHHPDALVPAATIADRIGRNVQSVRPEVGNLVLLEVTLQISYSILKGVSKNLEIMTNGVVGRNSLPQ